MLRLRRGTYEEVGTSEVFPGVSAQSVSRMLAQGKALGGTGWLRLAVGARALRPVLGLVLHPLSVVRCELRCRYDHAVPNRDKPIPRSFNTTHNRPLTTDNRTSFLLLL